MVARSQRWFAVLMIALTVVVMPLAEAAVQAQLSETVIEENDTVDLTIIDTGSSRTASPDLTQLNNDFEVLGTNRSSQFSSVNGRVEAWVEYRYQLRPKRTGTFTINPITVGKESTTPLMLTVRALDPSIRAEISELVFFEVSLDPEPVYVQAQVILSRRFFYARGVQLYTDLPDAPEVEGAVILPLGETQSTTTRRDSRTYGVVQQQYAIFPQASGTLLIPGESVSASVLVTRNGRSRRRGVQVKTQPKRLEVLPIPAGYPADAAWLPARSIEIIDQWRPEAGSLSVGEPARRRVVVKATGLIGSAIGPVAVDHPEALMKSYPEAPDMSDETAGDHVVGSRIQDYSLLPTNPGTLNLPAVSVTWWDTVSAEVKTTLATPHLLMITGTVAAPTQTGESEPTVQEAVPAPLDPKPVVQPWSTSWLWSIALAAVVAGWFGYTRIRTHTDRWRAKLTALRNPRVTAGAALKIACEQNELGAMRRELRNWLSTRYPDLDIDAAQEAFSNVEGNAPILDALDERLYSRDSRDSNKTRARDDHAQGNDEPITGAAVFAAAQRTGLKPPRRRKAANDPLPQLTIG